MCLKGKSDCPKEEAKYRCKKCDAFSKKEKHLCKPEKVKDKNKDKE